MKLTYDTYLPLAKVTEAPYATLNVPALAPHNATRLLHMALGLCTEALELQSSLARNKAHAESILEMSDLCWFSALAAEELGYKPTGRTPYPPQGIQTVYELCELFASRVKAALVYGTAAKKSDPFPDYWKTLPAEIFERVTAIGDGHMPMDGILQVNITKLRQRYGDKFSAHDALHRNEVAEVETVVKRPNIKVAVASADDLSSIKDALSNA